MKMGLKAAVQALQKAEILKAKVTRQCDLLNDSQAWTDQQQLQTVYHQVLVLDLEYALDKKVEQELWTLGFKNHISTLQELGRDKKNPKRGEYQALLSWCLSAASGFYLTLLQELCTVFELDLPFRRRASVYGQSKPLIGTEQLSQPHASSSIYICQYCLVHLGDIARYRLQKQQAESFYRHAIRLSPTSGHPYNQLALLEASGGDRLATVFHYVRSIAVKNPFPAAAANLAKTLTNSLDKDEPLSEIRNKMSTSEFIRLFLRVHGLLYLATDLPQAELCVKSINATLTAMVATQSFTSTKLIHMTVINLYALKHTVQSLSNTELTQDELKVKHLVLDMLSGALSAYLLPVYTLKMDSTLLEYYALPAIKIILNWIENEPEVLQDSVFTNRLQIWPSLCKLLNSLQLFLKSFDVTKLSSIPLPEDRDLQGFLPLAVGLKKYKFSYISAENEDKDMLLKLRAQRLINFGSWLTNSDVSKVTLITSKEEKDSEQKQIIVFEPANIQPDPTSELLEEIKHFSVNDNNTNNKTTSLDKTKVSEKRGGILKPQGSLEKAREEREQQALQQQSVSIEAATLSDNSSTSSMTSAPLSQSQTTHHRPEAKVKRTRQNVALEAILKKVEENKQVKFDTDSFQEKEKSRDFLNKEPPVQQKRQQQMQPQQAMFANVQYSNSPLLAAGQQQANFDFPMPNMIEKPSYHSPMNANYPNSNQQQHYLPQQQQQSNMGLQINSQLFTPQTKAHAAFNMPPNIPMPPSSQLFQQQQQPPPPLQHSQPSHNQMPPQYAAANPFSGSSGHPFGGGGGGAGGVAGLPKVPDYKPWSHQVDDNLPPMPPSAWWPPNTVQQNYKAQTQSHHVGFGPVSAGQYSAAGLQQIDSARNNRSPFVQSYAPSQADAPGSGMMPWGQIQAGAGQAAGGGGGQGQAMTLRQAMLKESKQAGAGTKTGQSQPFMYRDHLQNAPAAKVETASPSSQPSYSLFNSPIPNWSPNLTGQILKNTPSTAGPNHHQSLFSSTGVSPLEQLLEQQKLMRDTKDET